MTTHATPGGLIPGTEYFRGLLRSDQRDQAYVVLGRHGVAIDDARHLIHEGDHRPPALDLDRSAFSYGSDPQRSLGASAR